MNKGILVAMLVLCPITIGCIQQESTTSCVAAEDANRGGTSEKPDGTDGGPDGGSDNIGNNQSCSNHDECMSNECVPTVVHAPNKTGMCWSDSFNGCSLVDFEQWVIDDLCGTLELVVCQSISTPEMQADCVPTNGSTLPWEANFLCCDPSFL